MVRHSPVLRGAFSAAGAVGMALLVSSCSLIGGPHERGERQLKGGDFEGAREAFTEAIEAGDSVAIALANRCYASEALGDYEAAIEDCTRSLELADAAPTPEGYSSWEVLNNRAIANLGLGRHDEALADLDAAIELNPDYADAHANRGRILIDREKYTEAIAALDRAVELDPKLAEAFGNRGLAFENLGDDENAIADYTAAIDISGDPQAYFNRAMLHYTLGFFDKAFEDFSAVIDNASTPDDYLVHQAQQMVLFLENRPRGFDPETGLTATP